MNRLLFPQHVVPVFGIQYTEYILVVCLIETVNVYLWRVFPYYHK